MAETSSVTESVQKQLTSSTQQNLQSSLQNPDDVCLFTIHGDYMFVTWAVALAISVFAMVSLFYTIFRSYTLWGIIDETENLAVDLMDEALQLLLPAGVSNIIGHPSVNTSSYINAAALTKEEERREITMQVHYPDDVTYPFSNIEKVYDLVGDDDARQMKSVSINITEPTVVPTTPKLSQEKSSDGADIQNLQKLVTTPKPIQIKAATPTPVVTTPVDVDTKKPKALSKPNKDKNESEKKTGDNSLTTEEHAPKPPKNTRRTLSDEVAKGPAPTPGTTPGTTPIQTEKS